MRQRIFISIGIAFAALVVIGGALGATIATGTVTGTAGISLAQPATASFSDLLDGTDQTATYAPALSLIDARGAGAGWNLQISATTFSDGSGHSLAPGTVSSATQSCTAGSTCTAAVNSGITLPLTITTTAAKFFNAAVNSGLGKLNITPTITVAIPGNSYAGTYTSTVTLAATTGP